MFLLLLPLFLIASLSFPLSVSALSITEIMYDPEGADTGREWIEVYNDGSAADLSKWKFFEGGTNHGLVSAQGDATIPNGGYAVIADNPQKFLLDFPSYSGALFDSSFSLKNTRETLALKDVLLAIVASVTYDPPWGAVGDGNSLHKEVA